MKKLGKALIGLVAAVAMLFTGLVGSSTASAADAYKITIDSTVPNHTYKSYQIFEGDLLETKDETTGKVTGTTLSNIEWGDGVNGVALLAALKASV